jgi:hypothetical protein
MKPVLRISDANVKRPRDPACGLRAASLQLSAGRGYFHGTGQSDLRRAEWMTARVEAFRLPSASPAASHMVAKPPMSRDAEAKNLRLYDRRTIERNIKKGLITRKDYEKFLKSLEDAKEKGVMGGDVPEVEDQIEDDGVDDELDEDEPEEIAAAGETPPTGSNSH